MHTHVVGVQFVEAPRYKPEGCGFDSQYNPSGNTRDLGLTQPLTDMSIRNISLAVKVAGATFKCRMSGNLGASTSWNPLGL